jgi:hypothetical protein
MRNVKLKITKTNIKNGEQANPGKCPIANSIMDRIKNVYCVRVLPTEAAIKVKNGNKITTYKSTLTNKANAFVKKFDFGVHVSPFSFTLNLKKVKENVTDLV